jgi:hypothetical protein
MQNMMEIARENLEKAADQRGSRYNMRRSDIVYKVGDRVLRVNNVLSDASLGFSSGLAPAYVGPFIISIRIGKNVYDLVTLDDEPAGRRHADVLKLYREQPHWAKRELENDSIDVNSSVCSDPVDSDQSIDPENTPKLRPKRKIKVPDRYLD